MGLVLKSYRLFQNHNSKQLIRESAQVFRVSFSIPVGAKSPRNYRIFEGEVENDDPGRTVLKSQFGNLCQSDTMVQFETV